MTWSVRWMALPNGFNPANGRARLSLVASPRHAGPATVLGASPLRQWPTLVARVTRLTVVVHPSGQRIPATVVSARPDQALWDRLFSPTVPLEADTDEPPITQPVETSLSYEPAVSAISSLYDQALSSSPTELLRRDHPVAQAIAGLQAWMAPPSGGGGAEEARAAMTGAAQAVRQPDVAGLLDPARLTAGRIADAAALLRQQGHEPAAVMAPLVPVMNRLRLTGGDPVAREARKNGSSATARTPGAPKPSAIGGVKTMEHADFHQVVGLLLDHPTLARLMGLCIDLEFDAIPGLSAIRVISPSGTPLEGPVAVPQPWSRVTCDLQTRRFLMATDSNGSAEIVNGMLDLRPPAPNDPGGVIVNDLDVVALTEQLQVLASSMARDTSALSPGTPPPPIALPVRRDVGLTVAQIDRRSGIVERALGGAGTASARSIGQASEQIDGAPVLYADDVTNGYRVDLQVGDGPFRSLMRRHVRYHVGSAGAVTRQPIEAHDEGQVDPIVAVEQYDRDGNPHVLVGEEMFGYSNWSLCAPHPGYKVVAEGNGTPSVAPVEPAAAPGFPITIVTTAEPGTLPRLRYGKPHVFRARAVDLAGNSIDPSLCDPALSSMAMVYRRYEPVMSPALVPLESFRAGESLVRLVVLSDGDGKILREICQRHVAPPKVSQSLAELHGCFDEAFGPDTPARAAARARMLEIARREAGTFYDLQAPNPNGPGMVEVRGIAITTNDPVNRPPVSRLPLPRGEALKEGEYVVHNTPMLLVPYLSDPAASGVALAGLPGLSGPVKASFGSRPWPDLQALRLALRPATTKGPIASVVLDAGVQVLNVALPPGTVVEAQLSTTITPAGLDVMSLIASSLRQMALDGQVPMLSPRQPIIFVHAVQRPIEKPKLQFFNTTQTAKGQEVERDANSTAVSLDGLITSHAATSAQVDVEATWEEIVDRPGRPVQPEARREVAGSYTVGTGQNAIPFGAMPNPLPAGVPATPPAPVLLHRFSDHRHRRILYAPRATTRFREYFTGFAEGDESLIRAGDPVEILVRNATRPPLPVIQSVLPMFSWSRQVKNGVFTSVRQMTGFRVYLKRPWHQTGRDERLGVVVFNSVAFGNSMASYASTDPRQRLARLVSQWGRDPLEGAGPFAAPLLASDFPAAVDVQQLAWPSELTSVSPTSYGVDVAGHAVHFDEERDLWYSDVEIKLPEERFPFIRLALTRFQPVSIAQHHLSRIVLTDFLQLLPTRTLTARSADADESGVYIRVTGPGLKNTSFTAEHHRRIVDPTLEPRLDITEDALSVVPKITLGPDASSTPASIVMHGTLTAKKAPGQPFILSQDLLKGRIVVKENQEGMLHLKGYNRTRVIYVETFDRDTVLFPQGGFAPETSQEI